MSSVTFEGPYDGARSVPDKGDGENARRLGEGPTDRSCPPYTTRESRVETENPTSNTRYPSLKRSETGHCLPSLGSVGTNRVNLPRSVVRLVGGTVDYRHGLRRS